MANNENGSSFSFGFLFGGIIGVLIGVMLAPRSGSETRSDLADRSEVWRSRAEEMAARVRERVGPTVESARERLAPAVENVRSRVAPAVDTVRERVSPVVEQVSSRVGGGRQADSDDQAESPSVDGASVDGAGDAEENGEKPQV